MKQRTSITVTMMMEMCMWACCMRNTCCAHLSDVLSVSRVNLCAA